MELQVLSMFLDPRSAFEYSNWFSPFNYKDVAANRKAAAAYAVQLINKDVDGDAPIDELDEELGHGPAEPVDLEVAVERDLMNLAREVHTLMGLKYYFPKNWERVGVTGHHGHRVCCFV
jgi:hypothetical protein